MTKDVIGTLTWYVGKLMSHAVPDSRGRRHEILGRDTSATSGKKVSDEDKLMTHHVPIRTFSTLRKLFNSDPKGFTEHP